MVIRKTNLRIDARPSPTQEETLPVKHTPEQPISKLVSARSSLPNVQELHFAQKCRKRGRLKVDAQLPKDCQKQKN